MIKTYISLLIRKMREEPEWLAHKRGLSRHWEFGDFTSHNSAALKKEGEKKVEAERKMINVGRTARPSSILLSSLFGRH